MTIDEATLAEAEQKLSWLFKALQDYVTVSAWVGPVFEYDLPYHEMLALSGIDAARADRLRRRSLIAMLMACLAAIEEGGSVSGDWAFDALIPRDADEARLIAIVLDAFADARAGVTEVSYAMDRDLRWVHEHFVRNALDPLDALTGEPPEIPPALQRLAEEVARKLRSE